MIDEVLVIVPLVKGVADLTVLHEPAVSIRLTAAQGGPRTVTLRDRIDRANGIPPYEWPSACGVVGVVYAKGGLLEHRPWCGVCVVALKERGPKAEAEDDVRLALPVSASLTSLPSRSLSAKEAA